MSTHILYIVIESKQWLGTNFTPSLKGGSDLQRKIIQVYTIHSAFATMLKGLSRSKIYQQNHNFVQYSDLRLDTTNVFINIQNSITFSHWDVEVGHGQKKNDRNQYNTV